MLNPLPNNLKGTIILLLASIIWGSSFIPQKIAMDFWSPIQFTGLRFLIGSLILFIILPLFVLPKNINIRPLISYGVSLGVILGIAALFQQIGLVTTSATNAGFFTSLYVIIVPIIGIFLGSVPHFSLWSAILLCVMGSVLLAIPTGNFIIEKINIGDIWVISGSIFWALHFQLLSFAVKKNPIIILAIIQFFFASVALIILSLFFHSEEVSNFPKLTSDPIILVTLLYCSIGSVCLAFVLQMIGQKFSPPNQAAIVMSTEAIFAAFFGWLILSELFNFRTLTGSTLIFIGIIISQIYSTQNI